MRNTSIFLVFLTGIVALSLYGVFVVNGVPISQHALALDKTRLSNFYSASYAIQGYYSRNGKLPTDLDKELEAQDFSTPAKLLSDPETKRPYEYHVTGKRSYQLCTIFSADYKQLQTSNYSYPVATDDQPGLGYKKGHACVSYTLPSYVYAPTPTMSPNGSAYQESSINVTAPTWGSSVCLNQDTKITWNTKGDGLDTVRIGLFTGGTDNKYYDITSLSSFGDSARGSYTWKAGETATGITLDPKKSNYLVMQATFYGKTISGYGGEFELKNCDSAKKS
jgi:hypothetical protein